MADRATANLPSRAFPATGAFYRQLGFQTRFRDEGWMMLSRGPLELEFFPFPNVDPLTSWFSACIRVDDLDSPNAAFGMAGLYNNPCAIPRLTGPVMMPGVPRMFALVDCNGSLLRCLQNGPA